ncbi:MAG: hypothetical protein D8H97_03055, partial [Neisseria sp.]
IRGTIPSDIKAAETHRLAYRPRLHACGFPPGIKPFIRNKKRPSEKRFSDGLSLIFRSNKPSSGKNPIPIRQPDSRKTGISFQTALIQAQSAAQFAQLFSQRVNRSL